MRFDRIFFHSFSHSLASFFYLIIQRCKLRSKINASRIVRLFSPRFYFDRRDGSGSQARVDRSCHHLRQLESAILAVLCLFPPLHRVYKVCPASSNGLLPWPSWARSVSDPVSWLWLRFIVKVISTIIVRSTSRSWQERSKERNRDSCFYYEGERGHPVCANFDLSLIP